MNSQGGEKRRRSAWRKYCRCAFLIYSYRASHTKKPKLVNCIISRRPTCRFSPPGRLPRNAVHAGPWAWRRLDVFLDTLNYRDRDLMTRHGSPTSLSLPPGPECNEWLLASPASFYLRRPTAGGRRVTTRCAGIHLQNKSRLCVSSRALRDSVQAKRCGSNATRRDEARRQTDQGSLDGGRAPVRPFFHLLLFLSCTSLFLSFFSCSLLYF